MTESPHVQKFVVPVDAAGQRVDQWLTAQMPDTSRVRVQQLIEQEKVTVNSSVPKPKLKLRGGEEIIVNGQVELPPLKAFAEDIPLDIVYEDDDVAIINKPAGMTVHAGSSKGEDANKGTLVNALLYRFNRLSQVGGELRPGIVHRLDKNTSGLMVVAKSDRVHRKLAQQFAKREVKKTYIALVHGRMAKMQGTINTEISRDPVRRQRMTTRRSSTSKPGRSAITHWKVLKEVDGPCGKFPLVEVKIETGRTHQIRVHLASLGHPVAGDTVYGAPRLVPGYGGTGSKGASLGRHFLHSSAIQFEHPMTCAPLLLEQPLPAELKEFLRGVGIKEGSA